MAEIRLTDICKSVPDQVLEKLIPISILDDVAYHLKDWEELAPYICLSEPEQKEIKNDYDKQYRFQKRQALRRWRENLGDNATVKTIISTLCDLNEITLVETIVKMSMAPLQPTCISVHAKYLRSFYKCDLPHPAENQWPSLLRDFSLPSLFIDLKLHKVPINMTKQMSKKPVEVELAEVFGQSETRFMILFEGIAGSGKTTLSWHACKEWANEKLLQRFQLLIHIQVNDPRLQNVCALRDLIPDPDKEARDEIAQAILDKRGEGVCLLIEGIDEATASLRDFLLDNLLNSKLSHLSIIITSRPDSKLLIKIQKTLTSRILINGFSSEKLDEFLDCAMQEDVKGRAELDAKFKLSPQFQALCTLPINAVIVSFLVQCFIDELPVTQTGLFTLLVSHICIRHMKSRMENEDLAIEHLPDDLPKDLRKPFDELCSLAYTASMENRKILSFEDMKGVGIQDDKLGILQLRLTKSMYGLSKSYSFPHFALQQFLAAIHLSQQADANQISFIEGIIKKDPLDEVLPFHAGCTSNIIRTKIVEHLDCRVSLHDHSIASRLQVNPTVSCDPRRRTLALFKCLYECHDESLMAMVQLKMESISGDPGIDIRYVISFQNMWMSPLECLAVGYFVRYKSITMPERRSLSLNLGNCAISDTSVSVLTKELRRDVNYRTPGRIILSFAENDLSKISLLSVKELLKGQSNIEGLGLQKCFFSLDKTIFLKHIIEGLSSNTSCLHTAIGYNGLNHSHVYHLILLLQSCKQLRMINLSSCSLHGVMPLISRAFLLSNLITVQLCTCDIDDEMLVSLAKEISQSPHLIQIELYNNPLTPDGLMTFVLQFANYISILEIIFVDPVWCLTFQIPESRYCNALQQVNEFRKRHNRPELHLTSAPPLQLQNANSTRYLNSLNEPALSRKNYESAP